MKEDHSYSKIQLYWKDPVAAGYMAMTGRWLHIYATEVIISSSQCPENSKKAAKRRTSEMAMSCKGMSV
jgi:hypothetical protein